MVELIKFVVSQFAEKPELIDYDVAEKGNEVTVTVTLDESDMGKVIGRQGTPHHREGCVREGKQTL